MVSRQETQIVQSSLNLDDFLPGFTPSGRPDKREVGSSNLPRPIWTRGIRGSDARQLCSPIGALVGPGTGLPVALLCRTVHDHHGADVAGGGLAASTEPSGSREPPGGRRPAMSCWRS